MELLSKAEVEARLKQIPMTIEVLSLTVERRPKPGCRKCYGRGFVGWRSRKFGTLEERTLLLCKCIGKWTQTKPEVSHEPAHT